MKFSLSAKSLVQIANALIETEICSSSRHQRVAGAPEVLQTALPFFKSRGLDIRKPDQTWQTSLLLHCVWRELERAATAANAGHLGTHSFRHTHRSWLDAVGTSVAVQQKMMRHADIRTTMNIYGDVVTDEMTTAGIKVAQLAFQTIGAQVERKGS